MNRASLFIAVLTTGLVCLVPRGIGSTEYWTAITKKPELIVVGTLEAKARGVFTRAWTPREGVWPATRAYDIAYVQVDSVLWGEGPEGVIPIYWLSEEKFDPISSTRWMSETYSFEEGERNIWIVWPKNEDEEDGTHRFHSVAAVEIGRLEQVIGEIDKHLRK